MTSRARGKSPGGSTITQQLTRNVFPSEIGFAVGNRSWERKVKESLVAIRIEKRYTKEEIFTFYCNQIYFGHGAYGVEAASQLYFRKAAKDLNLEEAATLAGIIQGNVRQSPFVNPEATKRRRNYTLQRMADEGFIAADVAAATKEKPVIVAGEPTGEGSVAPYFLEEVRKHLEAQYGAKALYESGLTVKTALDVQAAAGGEQGRGPRPAPRRQAPRLSQAAPQRALPSARRSTASRAIAGRGASAKAISCPRSCAASPTPPRSCASGSSAPS